jgi:hypothetical protein
MTLLVKGRLEVELSWTFSFPPPTPSQTSGLTSHPRLAHESAGFTDLRNSKGDLARSKEWWEEVPVR